MICHIAALWCILNIAKNKQEKKKKIFLLLLKIKIILKTKKRIKNLKYYPLQVW